MSNYKNMSWPKIYDDMYLNSQRFIDQRSFYSSQIDKSKSVLEIACGTGLISLELLKKGIDIYGFDLSENMIDILPQNAKKENLNINHRFSVQNMVAFEYDRKFESIILPSRSFLHLVNQEEQIECLKRIKFHLSKDGFFIINFFNPSLNYLLKYESESKYESRGKYKDVNGRVYTLECKQRNDISSQTQHLIWRFTDEDDNVSETEMKIRWIYKEEFKLLLKLSGFKTWQLYGDFDQSEFSTASPEQIWIVN